MKTTALSQVNIRTLSIEAPLGWLQHGWEDFRKAPAIGLAHGISVSFSGLVLLMLFYDQFWLLAGLITGFLAVAPVIAVGLYAVSHALENSKPVSFLLIFNTWWSWRGHPHHDWRLVLFGLLLCLAGAGWVMTSAAFFTLFSSIPINQPIDFIRYVILSDDNVLFEAWWVLGIVLAAPIFASTVITLPLLLEREIPVQDAVMISWKVVLQNPVPMAFWALLIFVSTSLGVVMLIGSIVVVPVLSHASWHAYRSTVDASGLPARVSNSL